MMLLLWWQKEAVGLVVKTTVNRDGGKNSLFYQALSEQLDRADK